MTRVEEFTELIKNEFTDNRLTWQKGIATFHPESALEASVFIKLAIKNSQKLLISGFGNNILPETKDAETFVVIKTDRFNDLLEIQPVDFYVRVGAGFPVRELSSHLEKKQLYMPHASLPYVGSVGGAIAVNLSATLNGHNLPIKKYMIKAEIVTPQGEIINPGSTCFKSVSGYDIVKIFAPSWGLLGLVVSATFRIMPLSAIDEFEGLTMNKVDHDLFTQGLSESNSDTDAIYSRKIKDKFDPAKLFPVV